jgi:hypothetical protein
MLERAAAAGGEVAARRGLVMRAELDRAVCQQRIARSGERDGATIGGHAIATRGEARNLPSLKERGWGWVLARTVVVSHGGVRITKPPPTPTPP